MQKIIFQLNIFYQVVSMEDVREVRVDVLLPLFLQVQG